MQEFHSLLLMQKVNRNSRIKKKPLIILFVVKCMLLLSKEISLSPKLYCHFQVFKIPLHIRRTIHISASKHKMIPAIFTINLHQIR